MMRGPKTGSGCCISMKSGAPSLNLTLTGIVPTPSSKFTLVSVSERAIFPSLAST
jgi:hypothetical protein